jgi:DNA-binding NarL/FixJ family response regulator
MPALNGIDAARQIMHNDPHQKVAILSITDSEQVIHEALKAGAKRLHLEIRWSHGLDRRN